MRKKILPFIILSVVIWSCRTTKITTDHSLNENEPSVAIPAQPQVYQASETKVNDLVHTKLEVKFDWSKKQMSGKASITLHPHFYPQSSVTLDARGMDIHEVDLLSKDGQKKILKYDYAHDKLNITLDREYRRDENYVVFIDYLSKPEDLKTGGSEAINSDKGLYFINAEGKDPDKPKQIWTQGETQSNSTWLPTIDVPNQKMTQEIFITVDTNFKTLSNGLLISSTDNHDGTRTDYWKQNIPAAPYLTMMAVGDYAIVKDRWRNLDVNYYVEHEYEKYARKIFGNTPEMMEYFSTRFGVDFAWEKYSQIVVRDYVSGSMENASATLHGEFIQQNNREYLDGNYEDYISHELFHQWFGDLVTCESWSNTPLNEGFATYGEYLWLEHKFGKDDADYHGQSDLATYLLGTQRKDPDVIRFNYDDREDMFDLVSYKKGGRILHMLRTYVGDDAFFASMKEYLLANKFSSVEIHNLRLAFEKITGEDLNWFFNEWYLNHGFPVLDISYQYNDSSKKEMVTILQKQDLTKNPLYKLPVNIDVYANWKKVRQKVWIEKQTENFSFDVSSKPDLVNVDADKTLLCKKTDHKNSEEYIFQFYNAPLYVDRYEAIQKIAPDYSAGAPSGKLMRDALEDKFWNIRLHAIKNIGTLARADSSVKPKLFSLAQHDEHSSVRAAATKALKNYFPCEQTSAFLMSALKNDSSYLVVGTALKAITETDSKKGLAAAKDLEKENSDDIRLAIANIYSDYGTAEQNNFFLNSLDKIKSFEKFTFFELYGKFLESADHATLESGISKLADIGAHATSIYTRLAAVTTLTTISSMFDKRETEAAKKVIDLKKNNGSPSEVSSVQADITTIQTQKKNLENTIDEIKKNETDKELLKYYLIGK